MEGNTADDVRFRQCKYCVNIMGGQNVEKLCLAIIHVHKNLWVDTWLGTELFQEAIDSAAGSDHNIQ